MKNNSRIVKINSEIKKELALILRDEIKDPIVSKNFTTVTKVETTIDLKICKVYVSIMGKEKEKVIKSLKNAAGFIRHEVAKRVNLRNTPEFKFYVDDSLDYSMHMDELFKKI